jgi:xanthine dehydrogenase YagT iron-sulfur-binding subunit
MGAKPASPGRPPGVSRRGFLTTVGSGAMGAAALGNAAPARSAGPIEAGQTVEVSLTVNRVARRVAVEPQTTLLEVLRGQLGLMGAKPGCERGECGACTVLLNGETRYACQTLVLEVEGAEVTTVEGLMEGEALGRVQRAFVEEDGFQCGFCTCGQIVAAEGLLRRTPSPTAEEVREGMAGNLCRCGAYAHIVRAVLRAGEGAGKEVGRG